jgi:ABC-type molybdate transport system substrate-binding protein
MRTFGRTVTIAAMLIAFAGMARAADIRVLSVGAVQVAVRSAAADFQKETGHQVIFTVASPAVVMQKIKANEIHDAVIVSEPAMDQLDKEGLVNPESRVRLAKGEAETEPFAEGNGAKSPGPAPPALQLTTTYEGALMSDGSVPQEARAFIRFLASPDARDKWVAARLEPLPDH